VQTRTQRSLVLLLVVAAAVAGGLAWFSWRRQAGALAMGALDAVPGGALLVARIDLQALRASPVGAPFLREEREIPGLGKVRDVCGFDPMAGLTEIAVAIPAAGDSGEFGLVAAGAIQDEALLTCASKVIEARGGQAVVTQVGSFRAVRDANATGSSGEIAVRAGGPILLGGGAYLRAMIDSADGRAPSIRSSVAHSQLAREVGSGAASVTVVLTPEQRSQLTDELALSGAGSSPAASILAGAVGVTLGSPASSPTSPPTSGEVGLHGVLVCTTEAACADLGVRLRAARDARANDYATRLVGFGAALERVELQPEGAKLHLRVKLSPDEASVLVDRLVTLRGFRHPMPASKLRPPSAADAPPPDASTR
jgi:hypothetical protein